MLKKMSIIAVVAGLVLALAPAAQADPMTLGPITLLDFYGPGSDLSASIASGVGDFLGDTSSMFRALPNAFDGDTNTQWAANDAAGNELTGPVADFISLDLTGAPALGVSIDGLMWDNRGSGSGGDHVYSLGVTYYSDLFTTAIGTQQIFAGLTAGPDSFTFTAIDGVKSVRFAAVTLDADPILPGAEEIQLFGADTIPEPATMSLLVLGGLGVLVRRRRRA